MAEPTYQWNEITASQTDADSPIDTTLMEGIRQNLAHLRDWLGQGFTPAADHDHDGINSKSVLLADSVVTVAKLKMTRGSFTSSIDWDFHISLQRYSHYPSLMKEGDTYSVQLFMQTKSWRETPSEQYQAFISVEEGNNETYFVYWDYHAN